MTVIYDSPADLMGREGTKLGPTEWILVDQGRINLFADVTGDHQWIHVDTEKAKAGPFGKTIAHGYLTLSLTNSFLPKMLEVRHFSSGVNIGADNIRFLAPVPVGSRIRARGEILRVEQVKHGAIQSVVHITVEIEGESKPACSVDSISRYYP